MAPRNISQFKKWARTNQGIRLFLHYDQRKAVRKMVTLIMANQSSVLFLDQFGETIKIPYPTRGHYRFYQDWFSFKTMIFKYRVPDKNATAIETLQPTSIQLPAEEDIKPKDIWNDFTDAVANIEVNRDRLESEVNMDVMDLDGDKSLIRTMWGLAVKYGYDKQEPVLILPDNAAEFINSAPCPQEQIMVFGSRIQGFYSIKQRFNPKAVTGPNGFTGLFLSGNPTISVGVVNLAGKNFGLVIGLPDIGKLRTFEHSASEIYLTQATTPMEYYLTLGLNLLRPGGLFISLERVDPQSGQLLFLQTALTASKEAIAQEADILDAFRLPTSNWSGQEINSEILVFRKKWSR